jgi:hypothetical protein
VFGCNLSAIAVLVANLFFCYGVACFCGLFFGKNGTIVFFIVGKFNNFILVHSQGQHSFKNNSRKLNKSMVEEIVSTTYPAKNQYQKF